MRSPESALHRGRHVAILAGRIGEDGNVSYMKSRGSTMSQGFLFGWFGGWVILIAHNSWKAQKLPSISQLREQKSLALCGGNTFCPSGAPHHVQVVSAS